MKNTVSLSLHVPEPAWRPGEPVDFRSMKVPAAGSGTCRLRETVFFIAPFPGAFPAPCADKHRAKAQADQLLYCAETRKVWNTVPYMTAK